MHCGQQYLIVKVGITKELFMTFNPDIMKNKNARKLPLNLAIQVGDEKLIDILLKKQFCRMQKGHTVSAGVQPSSGTSNKLYNDVKVAIKIQQTDNVNKEDG